MISVERIVELAGSLGTVEGLNRVNTEIESLNSDLMNSKANFSREELAAITGALDTLSAAILAMDRVTRELLDQTGGGAADLVSY